jgi:hypothetical protein
MGFCLSGHVSRVGDNRNAYVILLQEPERKGKSKGTLTDPKGQRGGSGIALLFLDLGTRSGWVVNTTPRPLYHREKPGTHCTGGWVDPRAGLDRCGK